MRVTGRLLGGALFLVVRELPDVSEIKQRWLSGESAAEIMRRRPRKSKRERRRIRKRMEQRGER